VNAIRILLWLVFLASSLFMVVIVLLQESKGGGLAEAFGGVGAETFGVKTRGINKVTFTVAGVWFASALLLSMLWNV
jgi:preprotein translocase subunit SecG